MHHSKYLIIVKFLIVLLVLPIVSHASIKMDGYFIAEKSCEAVHSIKKGTDPFTLTKGMAYKVMAKNKPEASHYLITIEGLEENPNKWVSVDCGLLLTDCKTSQVEKLAKEKITCWQSVGSRHFVKLTKANWSVRPKQKIDMMLHIFPCMDFGHSREIMHTVMSVIKIKVLIVERHGIYWILLDLQKRLL